MPLLGLLCPEERVHVLTRALTLLLLLSVVAFIEGASLEALLNRARAGLEKGRCDGLICDTFVCVPLSVICDGQDNCQDGSDELFCPCPFGYFRCGSGEQCLPEGMLCDDVPDCRDGSDEASNVCGVIEGSGGPCPDGAVSCGEGECLEASQPCGATSACHEKGGDDNCHHLTTTELPYTTNSTPSPDDDLIFEESIKLSSSSINLSSFILVKFLFLFFSLQLI